VLNGLFLLYISQNLLGTIFRVTFTVFYRRIWNIVGKYSILCCDNGKVCLPLVLKYLGLTIRILPLEHARESKFPNLIMPSLNIHIDGPGLLNNIHVYIQNVLLDTL
jgi:hypothetical protein